VSFHKNSRL